MKNLTYFITIQNKKAVRAKTIKQVHDVVTDAFNRMTIDGKIDGKSVDIRIKSRWITEKKAGGGDEPKNS